MKVNVLLKIKMNLLKTITLIYFTAVFILIACRANVLPAFLLDYDRSIKDVVYKPNPFSKMTSNDFADIVRRSIETSEIIIIFVEETFSIEDVSVKDDLGTPFQHLREGLSEKQVLYFPNVIEPYKTLKGILQPRKQNVFHLNIGAKLKLPDDFKYFYVFFDNGGNETSVMRSRRHDMIIKEISLAMKQLKNGPLVAFYTGKTNRVDAVRNQISANPISIPVPKDLDVVIISEGALFRFSGVYSSSAKRRAVFNQKPKIAEETWTRRKLSTKMAYTDFELQFNFNLEDPNWWILDTVSLLEGGEVVGQTVIRASAPWNCSYICGEPIILVNARDGSSVIISKYQIQPLRPNSTALRQGSSGNNSTHFGPTVNCGPYFSINILAGLMVTTILGSILACGFTALYNCSTNNRYDDPSGKQLMNEING